MSLKYEPASEPLHIYVKWLYLEGLEVAVAQGRHPCSSVQGYLAHKKQYLERTPVAQYRGTSLIRNSTWSLPL